MGSVCGHCRQSLAQTPSWATGTPSYTDPAGTRHPCLTGPLVRVVIAGDVADVRPDFDARDQAREALSGRLTGPAHRSGVVVRRLVDAGLGVVVLRPDPEAAAIDLLGRELGAVVIGTQASATEA